MAHTPVAIEHVPSPASAHDQRTVVLTGFLFAIAAGVLWGTTGPLSTALYSEGSRLTDVGFWRVLIAVIGFLIYGAFRPALFRVDRKGLLIIAGLGGVCVAVFEVAFQFAIAGVGVASAVALLYTAPIIVAVLARPLLGEALTPWRVAMALIVMIGVWLTVNGTVITAGTETPTGLGSRWAGVIGGLLAAASFAGSTLLARWSVPRYGAVKVLFLELIGGVVLLGLLLPLGGHAPSPPPTPAGWLYILALGAGAVLAANFCFFAAARRIDAAPTAVAASIEPVVGALLALAMLGQQLTAAGWLGLLMVVGGVATGYLLEAARRASTHL